MEGLTARSASASKGKPHQSPAKSSTCTGETKVYDPCRARHRSPTAMSHGSKLVQSGHPVRENADSRWVKTRQPITFPDAIHPRQLTRSTWKDYFAITSQK